MAILGVEWKDKIPRYSQEPLCVALQKHWGCQQAGVDGVVSDSTDIKLEERPRHRRTPIAHCGLLAIIQSLGLVSVQPPRPLHDFAPSPISRAQRLFNIFVIAKLRNFREQERSSHCADFV